MITKGTKLALALLIALPLHAATPDDPGSRVARIERWLHIVLEHDPSRSDPAVIEISRWSAGDLDEFRIDLNVLMQLMRNPRLSSFQLGSKEVECIDCFAARRDTTQARLLLPGQRIKFTDAQVHRLQVLSCAAAGTLDSVDCVRLKAEREIDESMRTLALRAAAARRAGDTNYLLRRAGLLHTDVAFATASSLRPMDVSATPQGEQAYRVHMVDGQATAFGLGDIHWAIGRDLIDAIRPRPDAMARRWYIATGTWMQREQQYNPGHLQRARDLFPDDATIAFLIGTQAEVYASPAIQTVMKTAVLPTGFVVSIGSESSELKTAESLLHRSVQIDPTFPEAHLHLGHVLLARGKTQEAVSELNAVMTPDPLLRYYRDLFLGAAEEALLHTDAARTAYEDAAALFPRAQSPALALSALHARRGERAPALAAIGAVFDLPADAENRHDPWWRYAIVQGRNADDLLDELVVPFRAARP